MSEEEMLDYADFARHDGRSNTFGEGFEKWARGYKYSSGGREDSITINTIANLHDMQVRADTTQGRRRIVRDLGAVMTGTGRYRPGLHEARESLQRELDELLKKKKRK